MLAYLGHALTESRNALIVDSDATQASGTANHEAARELMQNLTDGATLGADNGYYATHFVEGLKALKIVPHIAIQRVVIKLGEEHNIAVPPEVAASETYKNSLRKRKWIEKVFDWGKTVCRLAQLKERGLKKVKAAFLFNLLPTTSCTCQNRFKPGARSALKGKNTRNRKDKSLL